MTNSYVKREENGQEGRGKGGKEGEITLPK